MADGFDVVVVGAGAAGIAALRRLRAAGVSVLAVEARDRVGGRAHTVAAGPDLPLDLGCGWLHSADQNPLVAPIEKAGFTVDRSRPHWERQSGNRHFPADQQRAFREAFDAFEARLAKAAEAGIDHPASDYFETDGRWNPLMDAVSSYYNGAEYSQVSILDYDAYDDSGVNWRVAEGYGTAIASFAALAHVRLGCAVQAIRHDGAEMRLETTQGTLTARAVIVTIPTPLLARIAFSPALPDKLDAAAGLPLGLADKVAFALRGAEDFPKEGHLFGHPDRTDTGSYHLRPFGRPYVEAFLGGQAARTLEGQGAATRFCLEELESLMGGDFRTRLTPLTETAWATDPWARGSYSHALPGHAGDRAILAAPVDGRLFFAGEATSAHVYSTAHGAWETGERAADEALAALSRPGSPTG